MLSVQKVKAIENEDYETAQMIKNEMNKIQKTILTTNDRNGANNLTKGRGATLSPIEYRSKPISKPGNSQSSMNIDEAYGSNSNALKKPLNPLGIKSMRKVDNLPQLDHDIFAPKIKIGIDERSLPALGRETPIDFSKVNEEEYEHQKPNQINASKLTLKVDPKYVYYLDKLTGVFGEDMAKKVWADKWYFQQEGIDSAVKSLKESLQSSEDSDKILIIGFLSDLCADADLKVKTSSSKTGRKIKKNIKNLKKRLELYSNLVMQANEISNDMLNEVFKRLPAFIDHTDLKQDLISSLETYYSNYGYEAIDHLIQQLGINQLEQIKNSISEAKTLIEEKLAEKERRREQLLEEK